MQALNLDLLLH
jgi:hypothetical protein